MGIVPLVAQAEREAIPRRAKEALAVAKVRAVRLGNPNGAANLKRAVALRDAIATNADAHAQDLTQVVVDIRLAGATNLRAVADALVARRMLTRRSGRWRVSTVRNLVRRVG